MPDGRVRVNEAGPGMNEVDIHDQRPNVKPASAVVLLHHEMLHGLHFITGTGLRALADPKDEEADDAWPNHEESSTIGLHAYRGDPMSENALRREMGIPERTSALSVCDKPGTCKAAKRR